MDDRLKQRIDEMILQGGTIKEQFDLSRPVDRYILERLAYFKIATPLMVDLHLDRLPEDVFNNCIIEMYLELKKSGKILVL